MSNRDFNIDQNNHDYEFCHNEAALTENTRELQTELHTPMSPVAHTHTHPCHCCTATTTTLLFSPWSIAVSEAEHVAVLLKGMIRDVSHT